MPTTEPSYIEIERSGGQLATYRPKTRVDLEPLSADDRQRFDELVSRAQLDRPESRAPEPHIADAFTYRLTVKLPGYPERTVLFTDQDGHARALDELVEWVRAQGTDTR